MLFWVRTPQSLYTNSHSLGNILPKHVIYYLLGLEKMNKKIIYTNSVTIAILALIATLAGLSWKGLYQHDTISGAAQMMGQDLVTLLICIPLLIGTLYLIKKRFTPRTIDLDGDHILLPVFLRVNGFSYIL